MCLIVVAHRASDRFPLVIAANRDEEYERPSLPAQFWGDEAIVGGRDELHGGSWLAMTRSGRFAAVTNLRGSSKAAAARSRGELVSGFVRGDASARAYVEQIAPGVGDYGGFHLLVGEAGGELVQLSESVIALEPGIHGLSNAPLGVRWPKVDLAVESVKGALEAPSASQIVDHLLRLLRNAPAHGDPTRDLFVHGDRYGTRASTAIVVSDDSVLFVEQNYGPGGAPIGSRHELAFALERAR